MSATSATAAARNLLSGSEAALAQQLQDRFAHDPPEPKCALDANLRTFILDAVPATANQQTFAIRSLECRSNLCRVETYHADSERCRAFLLALHARLTAPGADPFVFFTHLLNSEEGNILAVTYFARAGRLVSHSEVSKTIEE
jgi:hypothetical protein